MSRNLYLTTIESKSGKSIISLGLMEILKGVLKEVAFFRPIINVKPGQELDPDILLINEYFHLGLAPEDTYAYTFEQARDLISEEREAELLEGIIEKYKALENRHEFVLIEGTDFGGVTSAFEFDINAEIANNLGAPVLLVTNAKNKTSEEVVSSLNLAVEYFEEKGCTIIGAIANRVLPADAPHVREALRQQIEEIESIYALPENPILVSLTMADIKKSLNAAVLYGEDQLHRHAFHHIAAAMQLRNFLNYIQEGSLIITPGDRADIILGSIMASNSKNFPHTIGLVLTGGLKPEDAVWKLITGSIASFPILSVETDTLRTVSRINEIDSKISPADSQKITTALGLFEAGIDIVELRERIIKTTSRILTPKMFEYGLIQQARKAKKHIVLPEGNEDRILKAAELLLRRDVVDITLLGDPEEIRTRVKQLGLNIDAARIINPLEAQRLEEYIESYFQIRQHKGITLDMARDAMLDVSYFGTMMVHKGHADGMVSGAVHTTRHTVRPAFEFIKTKPGTNIVSSVFFMCLEDQVLVYGDCAVITNPTADELSDIAISSADTAAQFGVEPVVALLSYSSGESGEGEDVERVREATRLAREKAPHLLLEGPLQYDAAIDPGVARVKMPDSRVAGRATVLIFPDLNTGNNTYKAVQRSANAVAIGPVLQGLNKPVNDLSRGCTVPDIVNTVAITAIQAQHSTR